MGGAGLGLAEGLGLGAGGGLRLGGGSWGGPGLGGRRAGAVYGGREGGAGGWGLGHGCDTPATHANASRTLRERFSDDPWSTIGPLDPNL